MLSRLFFWRRKRPLVPVVRLSGVIAASGGRRRGISLESVEPQLKKAFSIKGAKAVALVINSPGGSPVQSSLIGQRVRDLARKANLPVLAFCEDVAASGGYWLAASADEIYANPASVIGSIGVVSAGFGFDRAIDKLGVDRRVYTAGENKMILDPFQPEAESDVARLKSLQEEIHQQFIDHVVERRGAKLTGDHDDLFSGAFWTGAAAVDLGLIDGIGECRRLVTERFGDNVDLLTINPKRRLFDGFGGLPGTMTGRVAADIVDETVALAVERAHLARYGPFFLEFVSHDPLASQAYRAGRRAVGCLDRIPDAGTAQGGPEGQPARHAGRPHRQRCARSRGMQDMPGLGRRRGVRARGLPLSSLTGRVRQFNRLHCVPVCG